MPQSTGVAARRAKREAMGVRASRAPYAERLRAHEELLARGASRLVDICCDLGDVRAVYAFGSFATGAVRLHSDLDVLVVRDTPLRRVERDLDIRLAFDVSVGLDMIVVTPNEFERVLPHTSFGQTILRTAKRLDAAG